MDAKRIVSIAPLAALTLATLVSVEVYAQVAGATLSGTVTDATGGVIPGAQVSIQNVATGVIRKVSTDEAGFYTAPNLLPGTYDVTCQAQGYSTVVQKGITLTVGAAQALNLSPPLGQVSQTVEVRDAPPTVQLTSSTISGHVDATTVRELPLNGRDWTQLATLEPGVISVRAPALSGATSSRGNRGFGSMLS